MRAAEKGYGRFLEPAGKKGPYPFFAVLLFAVGCGPSPELQFAHTVERVASWASAAQFVDGMAAGHSVPASYARDAFRTAARSVAEMTQQVADLTDVDGSVRGEAVQLCDELATALRQSDPSRRLQDAERVRAIEQRLRTLATSAREADRRRNPR